VTQRGLLALLLLPLAAAAPPADHGQPYRILQQANLGLDPDLAASAYAADAKLIFDYPGRSRETFQGRDAIRSSYVRTFKQVDPGTPIKLEFRFERPGLATDRQAGAYRIDATAGGKPVTLYGRFSVKLAMEGGPWRFAEDYGTPATAADFEKLPPSRLSVQ
jgi:hypothetical protein